MAEPDSDSPKSETVIFYYLSECILFRCSIDGRILSCASIERPHSLKLFDACGKERLYK